MFKTKLIYAKGYQIPTLQNYLVLSNTLPAWDQQNFLKQLCSNFN